MLRESLRTLRGGFGTPDTGRRLRSQPVVAYVVYGGVRYPVRRMRINGVRVGFVIREDLCRVWFIAIVKRTNSTYRRRRWG